MVRFSRVWRVVLRMGHPLGRWSVQMMTQDGGKTAQLQGDHEGFRDSTTKLGGMWSHLLKGKHSMYMHATPGTGMHQKALIRKTGFVAQYSKEACQLAPSP